MAYTTTFALQNPSRVITYDHIAQINVCPPPLQWLGTKPRPLQVNYNHISRSKNTQNHILKHPRHIRLIPALAAESDSISAFPTPSDVIRRFYTFINEKDLKQLEDLISSDCLLEDSAFPHSFQGKKEVMIFIRQLVESMGENVHFRVGIVCEGEELTASLDWHLEWKQDQIPFSRGCSIFQCTVEQDILVIKKAQIITESPIKPGQLALGLLKMIASLFDEFPKAARWFLKSPHTIFKVVLNIYNLLFAPIMNPVLGIYITLWKLLVRLLGYVLGFLHIVARLLNGKSKGDPDD